MNQIYNQIQFFTFLCQFSHIFIMPTANCIFIYILYNYKHLEPLEGYKDPHGWFLFHDFRGLENGEISKLGIGNLHILLLGNIMRITHPDYVVLYQYVIYKV